MFGYVLANRDILTPQEQQRYRSLYCGLCESLYSRYGTVARFTLRYDMVFLVLLINGLFELQEQHFEKRCAPHPFKKHSAVSSAAVDYAADMSVLLTYEKLADDIRDEHSAAASAAARSLKKAYEKACVLHPQKSADIKHYLGLLYSEEQQKGNIDTLASLFGEVMGVLFDYGSDIWTPELRSLGFSLGRFIYVLDAYVDFESDRKKGRFNPLPNNRDESVLRMLMDDVAERFEHLPIVQDIGIIRNIIYSGVWLRYNGQKRRDENSE